MFFGKNLQNHVFSTISCKLSLPNIIISCTCGFCHLCVCSPEVLDRVRYQKQLLAPRKQTYFLLGAAPRVSHKESVLVQKSDRGTSQGPKSSEFHDFSIISWILSRLTLPYRVRNVSVTSECVPWKY